MASTCTGIMTGEQGGTGPRTQRRRVRSLGRGQRRQRHCGDVRAIDEKEMVRISVSSWAPSRLTSSCVSLSAVHAPRVSARAAPVQSGTLQRHTAGKVELRSQRGIRQQ